MSFWQLMIMRYLAWSRRLVEFDFILWIQSYPL